MLSNKIFGFVFFWRFGDTAVVCRGMSQHLRTSAASKMQFSVALVNVTLENEKLIIYYNEFHTYIL